MTEPAGGVEVAALELGPIATNCYLVWRAGAAGAVVVDPGADAHVILAALEQHGLRCAGILVTHVHWDHVGAVAGLVAATGAAVWMSDIEAPALECPEEFAFPGVPEVPAASVDHRVTGGDTVDVAGISFRVLHVPGHSPGHLAFVAGDQCFSGDVLFRGSVGRTDLPFGDSDELMRSLALLVGELPESATVYPGHGPTTTIADELRRNPFMRTAARRSTHG